MRQWDGGAEGWHSRPSEGFQAWGGGEEGDQELRIEIKRDEQMQVGGMEGREESRAECHRGGNQERSLHTGPNNKGQPG